MLEQTNSRQIDLVPYAQRLLNGWKWILLGGIVLALVGAYRAYSRTPVYTASTFLTVAQPSSLPQFDSRIRTTTTTNSNNFAVYESLSRIAVSDEVLMELIAKTGYLAGEENALSELKGQTRAVPVASPVLVRLELTMADQQNVANLANAWAKIVALRANELYSGQGEVQVDFYAEQLIEAENALATAQDELVAFQANSRLSIMTKQLASLEQALADYLQQQRNITYFIQDALSLAQQVSADSGNVSTGNQLAALLIQVRALDSQNAGNSNEAATNIQLAINELDTLANSDASAIEASLLTLVDTLSAKAETIEAATTAIEPEILALQAERQRALSEFSIIDARVKLNQQTVATLANKAAESTIFSSNETGFIQVASFSSMPDYPAGSRKLFIIAIAGIVGLVLAALVLLALEWRQQALGSKTRSEPSTRTQAKNKRQKASLPLD